MLSEALRSRVLQPPPRWPERAVELFFREFADEDMDFQLKVAEKLLLDDNKAMIFCLMQPAVRRHWVKKVRDALTNRMQ